ncbi:MAG TPA: hypothetical protein H9840_05040 [Candidatus Anaerofilum excrementigallinarum]|nr:hypothetical protein [Candidatus Anaerofilum excrementigallinarum]
MSGYGVWGLEQAFPGRRDCTTPAMQRAVADWFGLYFDDQITLEEDPCQRLPVVVVSKLQRACFAEYRAICGEELGRGVLRGLEEVRSKAMQLALIGGECWLRPALTPGEISFTVLRRDAVAVLARDSRGRAVELVSGEEFRRGKEKYTLLERRCQTGQGTLVENRLFCSRGGGLGMPVPLDRLPQYAALQPRLLLEGVEQLGLVNLRLPLENCVDGSPDPVSVYAAAAGLIHNINRNERQLCREFENGQSRVFAAADLLYRRPGGRQVLPAGLFVGLDDDPSATGITIFSPALRQQSFLERKREYLRNLESLIGLKRGLLGEVEAAQRTATEVTSSQGDYALTIRDLQLVWQQAAGQALALCRKLAGLYGLPTGAGELVIDWGNGVLFDREKAFAETLTLVENGMLRPEIALAWRYGLPWETEQDLAAVRQKYMPVSAGGQ